MPPSFFGIAFSPCTLARRLTGGNRLVVVAPPSGVEIPAPFDFEDIPGLSTSITTEVAGPLSITFSAEAWASSGRLIIRALVDGVNLEEITFVEAGDPERSGTRAFTFVKSYHPVGVSQITLQWQASGIALIGNRTMSVSAGPPSSQRVLNVTPVNPQLLTGQWADLAPAELIQTSDSVSNISVCFSTEAFSTNGRILVRMLLDGQPASPADITLIQGGPRWRATAATFIAKNVARGNHLITVQGCIDPQTTAKVRRRTVSIFWKCRRGADFVQPFFGMKPQVRRIRLLVIGFDPVRPSHQRPSFEQIRNVFEGDSYPNLRDWLAENSGGISTVVEVRYVGCADGQWYLAPPERQGNWYWDNHAFDQMFTDGLNAADVDVNFHWYDEDKNNRLTDDELVVALVRPQNDAYGTLRGSTAILDGNPVPLNVPLLDLYLSSDSNQQTAGVGLIAHELSHHVFGAPDLYGNCAPIDPGIFSVMGPRAPSATHLDPFVKLKNGFVRPWAIDLDTLPPSSTVELPAVEIRNQILILHDAVHVAREYFLLENRYPGDVATPNYDYPIGAGFVVLWHIFEDLNLLQTSAICPGDPRFIRRIKTLGAGYGPTFDLRWADGSPAGVRVSVPLSGGELVPIKFEKI